MPDIQKQLENIRVLSGRLHAPYENEPNQHANRGYPYLNPVSTRFYQEYAKYSTDYFHGEAQGLNPEDFYAWETLTLRMADLVKTSAAMQRQFDNHKMILLDAMKYAYIPRGAKFVTMGSTWLCTNPMNISGGEGMAVIQRCNAVWNHLDWYGNVVSEPIAIDTDLARANAPDPQYNMPIMKGYFNAKCQYNENTRQIDDNTRMILGSSCYVVTGFADFLQEFTGDYESVRFLEFTLRKEEPNKTIDDMVNHVAGGLTFSWDISVSGPSTFPVGGTVKLSASSMRCGEAVVSTEENPVSYLWSSSDPSVVTVDENGTVTGVSEGNCFVTVTLEQNPDKQEVFTLSVTENRDSVAWETTPPEKLSAYESVQLTVTAPDGANPVWTFSGADPQSYSVSGTGNSRTLNCWGGSVEPLRVSVAYNGTEASAVIPLIGI